uniref:Ribosome biogenesis protein bop1-like n=1 Tax=Sinocyclocheilus grahami TaxID=75366 RepID=A0A672KHD9_SINGR
MEWYKDYPHIGYDLEGKKIFKPIRNKDELDEFLDKMENPDYWRTVQDKMTGADIRLSDEQVDLVHRLQQGKFGDVNFNEYEPAIDFFSNEVMIHPVTNRPQDKRSFIPSLIEKEKVGKLVHAIKMGWIKPHRPKETTPQYYDLWAKEDPNSILGRHKMHIPAPKMKLPGHEESYNPPPEYLMSEEERLAWEQQDPEYRKLSFLPQKFACLRAVPAYSRFIHERFERCLDLYLCPRQRKMRVNVNPEDLIPKLPKPKDLQPFPTTQSLVYRGHSSLVRSISISPSGQWLVSGSDDCTVRFWEVSTARCLKTVEVGGAVKGVAWNPNPSICLVAVMTCDISDHSLDVRCHSFALFYPFSTGDNVICGSYDCRLAWFDLDLSTKPYKVLRHHKKALRSVAYHRHYPLFASGSDDGNVIVCHGMVLKGHTITHDLGVLDVTFHPTQPWVFSSGADGTVRLFT